MGKNKEIQSTPHVPSNSYFMPEKQNEKETPVSDRGTNPIPLKQPVNFLNFNWWFWFVNLVFIVLSISGWKDGYYIVMEVSFLNLFYFLLKEKSFLTFSAQVRLFYFLISLTGFWTAGRFYVYLLLLVETFLITFYGKCSIAMVLKQMPWNRRRETRLE